MDLITYRNMYKVISSGDKETKDAIVKLLDFTIEATMSRWLVSSTNNSEATQAYLIYLKLLKWNIVNAKEHYKGLKEEMDTLDWMVPEWLSGGKSGKQALAELMYDMDFPVKPHKGGKHERK